MDKIEKALQKLTKKEQRWVKDILKLLNSGNIRNLDVKKLKGRNDIFRVRRGNIRIIYRRDAKNALFILSVERKNETTYR